MSHGQMVRYVRKKNYIAAKGYIISITDEIGYGIVPVDRMEREYREQTGRVCTRLAAYSEKVYRVMCGIGQVIKEV